MLKVDSELFLQNPEVVYIISMHKILFWGQLNLKQPFCLIVRLLPYLHQTLTLIDDQNM